MLLSLVDEGSSGCWKITHNDDELTEDLLREGLCESIADLGGGAHFSCQQGPSLRSGYTYCAQQPNQ